jgi:hypothetical protein
VRFDGAGMMQPLSFSDEQLLELLRLAMEIQDDRARDRFFASVAAALHGRAVTDMAVRVAANAAFAAEAPRTVQEEVMPPAPDACVLGRAVGSSKWATR